MRWADVSLRDQLLAKGLVTKKRVQQVERELKQERREQQSQRKAKRATEAELREAERAKVEAALAERRQRRLLHEEAKAQVERALRIRNLILGNQVKARGGQPFWHPSADGRELLRLWVSPGAAAQLRRGELGVAAMDHGHRVDYVLVRGEAARALHEMGAKALVFFVTDLAGISAPDLDFLRREWEPDLRSRRYRPPASGSGAM